MIYTDAHPLVVFGRLLTCTRCAAHVDLIELPRPWIDEERYVCGPCLEPVADSGRRNIHDFIHGEPPAPPARRDMSTYDPATEPWPVGF